MGEYIDIDQELLKIRSKVFDVTPNLPWYRRWWAKVVCWYNT